MNLGKTYMCAGYGSILTQRLEKNKQTYESADVVALYRSKEGLYKPEETILHLIKPAITGGQVLDIGVGGGRTTPALSSTARKYVGIDYSAEMIAACKEKFRGASERLSFLVCDVRDMGFADHTFDVVMFSGNGLDSCCCSQDHRLIALQEIRRVCLPGGFFVFSTHNLRFAPQLFRYLPSSWLPRSLLLEMWKNHRRRALNQGFRELLKCKYAIFSDGMHSFRSFNYYVDPRYQIEQLHTVGFGSVRAFPSDGAEINTSEELDRNRDPWLYFVCQART